MSDIVERFAPCPFCGNADPEFVMDARINMFVMCYDCGARGLIVIGGHGGEKAEAIAAWNRRSDAAITALREEVERLTARCSELSRWADGYGKLDADYAAADHELTALRRRVLEVVEKLRFNVTHLVAEDDKDDALATLEHARDVMAEAARTLAPPLFPEAPPMDSKIEPVAVTDEMTDAALAFWCAKLPKKVREQPVPALLREHMRGTLAAALAPALLAAEQRGREAERAALSEAVDIAVEAALSAKTADDVSCTPPPARSTE